jgi:hypothetical protein
VGIGVSALIVGLSAIQGLISRTGTRVPELGPYSERRYTVFANLKIGSALVALVCIAVAPNASAVTAEVAKKCNALTAKAYPPRVVGNPAAGSAKGTGQSKRDYFNKCVTNGGNMDDPSSKGDSDERRKDNEIDN